MVHNLTMILAKNIKPMLKLQNNLPGYVSQDFKKSY